MDTRKAIGKGGTYPPAPSVEDDSSPASSTHDFDDDCHAFDEAYLQAYAEYKHFGKELGQEEDAEAEDEEAEAEAEAEEEQEEEFSQILIEYMTNIDSPTASSTFHHQKRKTHIILTLPCTASTSLCLFISTTQHNQNTTMEYTVHQPRQDLYRKHRTGIMSQQHCFMRL